ncbi:HECT-domain (ubiquitin-transferase) domain-containing protein [Cryptosporidium felis]|nr:HECT-domain (ubiquitin-transferase) domain-containing protein [Cryptosporidium felis]
MFGWPGNRGGWGSKAFGNGKLILSTNLRNSRDLDIPVSIGASNRDNIQIRKKEKERRILERLRTEKLKLITHYFLQMKKYNSFKREFSSELSKLQAPDGSLKGEECTLDHLIRIFRFTIGLKERSLESEISLLYSIIKQITHTGIESNVSKWVSSSNLLFLFRNCLILMFLDLKQQIKQKIETNILVEFANQTIRLYFSDCIKNNNFKKSDIIEMVLNFPMVDLLFIRYLHLRFVQLGDKELDLFKDVVSKAVRICTDFQKGKCNFATSVYYMGRDLLNFEMPKEKGITRNFDDIYSSLFSKFSKARYNWLLVCFFSLVSDSKTNFGDSNSEFFCDLLKTLDLRSFLDFAMKEDSYSIRVEKLPFQLLPPSSCFSFMIQNYTLFIFLESSRCRKAPSTVYFSKHVKSSNTSQDFPRVSEDELFQYYKIISIWDPDLFSPKESGTNDNVPNRSLSTVIFLSELISIANEEKNKKSQDPNSISFSSDLILKVLILLRLHSLFLSIREKITLMEVSISSSTSSSLCKQPSKSSTVAPYFRIICNKEVILPILNLALTFASKSETISDAINIVNLVLDVYFPLNRTPREALFENIKFCNFIERPIKLGATGYLHNALDLCAEQELNMHCRSSSFFFRDPSNRAYLTIESEKYEECLPFYVREILDPSNFQKEAAIKKLEFYFLVSYNSTENLECNDSESLPKEKCSLLENLKTNDLEFLEYLYNNSPHRKNKSTFSIEKEKFNQFNRFCNQVIFSETKILEDIQGSSLNFLVYETYWTLVLFFCVHNTLIFSFGGNFALMLHEIFSDGELNLGYVLKAAGQSLNYQLSHLDDFEVKICLESIVARNKRDLGSIQSFKDVGVWCKGPELQSIPFLKVESLINDQISLLAEGTSGQQISTHGSEVFVGIMTRLRNSSDLGNLVAFERVGGDLTENNASSGSPILLINNTDQLDYVSLFVNNLTFSVLEVDTKLLSKDGHLLKKTISTCFGQLTKRLYQNHLKLKHFQVKPEDPIARLPWTILKASNLLKPRDVLIDQALQIESLGSLPTYNGSATSLPSGNAPQFIDYPNFGGEFESRFRGRTGICDEEDSIYGNLEDDYWGEDQYDDEEEEEEEEEEEGEGEEGDKGQNHYGESNYRNSQNDKTNLLRIFDSTLKFVCNKSKFELLKQILREMPHLISFEDRLHFYYHYIAELRFNHIQPQPELMFDAPKLEIRRTHLIEDGLNAISSLDPNRLRGVFRIVFLDEQGGVEPGIDGGGLLKDFITSISRELCSESFGLFKTCENNTIIPKEYDGLILTCDKYKDIFGFKVNNFILYLFEFLGKIVGKAIYEKILLEIDFNPAFLNSVFGQSNDFLDLSNLDGELFKNLNYLKNMNNQEEIKNLSLTFSVTLNLEEKKHIEVDLIPNGRRIPVNHENKLVYIKLLTHYKLITSIKLQTEAFLKGLSAVIPNESLKLFSPYELQALISGVDQKIDFDNLKSNTCYSGYLETSPQIVWFWEILKDEFSNSEQREFLLFVTSSRKAPLLGFQHLNPKFGIQIVPDNSRLPSASTCFNLLKLPTYSSKEILKHKLRQAIFNSKGFDLS